MQNWLVTVDDGKERHIVALEGELAKKKANTTTSLLLICYLEWKIWLKEDRYDDLRTKSLKGVVKFEIVEDKTDGNVDNY